MFQAVGHKLEGDHLDLSFRDTDSWTRGAPGVDIPNQWIVVGDPDTGPTIGMGVIPDFPQEGWLDTHYHGSDQFRVILKGEFLLQTHRMKAGDFGYQESGRPYREGMSAGADGCWLFNMHGTWRGARATRIRSDGTFPVPDLYDHQLDRFTQTMDDPCWWNVRGGPKGVAAVKTTLDVSRGYAWGSFDDAKDWIKLADGVAATAGLFGLPETGPVLFTLKAEPRRVIAPSAVCGTELVYTVVRGSAEIGGKMYGAGDLRVQAAETPVGAAVSGPEGADMIFLLADRRERPRFSGDEALAAGFNDTLDTLLSGFPVAQAKRPPH